MRNNDEHGKIIKELCKELLLPLGVFQKRTSRIYIDDNGWYFTVIEFQPSGWDKGTFLNIALHFLWSTQDYISFDFYTGDSPRVKRFVAYENAAQFERCVRPYVLFAREQILFYRNFRSVDFVESYCKAHPENPKVQALQKMNSIHHPDVAQRIQQTRAFWRSKPAMKKMHAPDFHPDADSEKQAGLL